ncbi:MAG: hypothetical protein D6819_04505 [Gammaproteobacteria bacterium]|nr:MAG: hypothetical protein D6819_04505 [Gammaproteobacteria bacterium]
MGSIEEVQEEGLMVIGGASIYEQMIPRATRLYLTVIHHAFPGDAFFPPWDEKAFDVVEREDFAPDAENPYPYTFLTLVRKP